MIGFGLMTHDIDLVRRTSFVIDSVAASASMTLDRQPSRASLMKLIATESGSATFTGTVDGSADTETLALSAAGSKRGVKQFTAVSGVTSTDLGTITVEATDVGGQPQHADTTVVSIPAARTFLATGNYENSRQGPQQTRKALWALSWSDVYTPRTGDLIRERDTLNTWFVETVDIQRSGIRPMHWELECRRYET